jgi:FkbM family methyltransferase
MYDGADTCYYLESGNKVLAVEANPALCAMADQRLSNYVQSGQLTILNVAVSNIPGTIDLHICGQDLGSSSIYADRIAHRFPLGSYQVSTVTLQALIAQYGRPDFVKIDIEGADRDCILSLTQDNAPPFLSFEAHDDLEELLAHGYSIGYRNFKLIHQNTFRALQNQDCLKDRISMKLVRLLGYEEPRFVRRNGRLFMLGHSAGPAPWDSDGGWYGMQELLTAWKLATRRGRTGGWYDVHATMTRA